MKKYLLIISCCFLFLILQVSYANQYHMQSGDILFQDLDCGILCNAIDTVTRGYDNTEINHVAMIIKATNDPKTTLIIEANNQVAIISLQDFLARSLDENSKPRVMVARLKKQYQYLIPMAIINMQTWLGKPYNKSFTENNNFNSFYCSQLLYDAFLLANKYPFFNLHNMNFKKNGKFVVAWQEYFNKLKIKIPQGELGSNPGMMSRSNKLEIIYFYGKLRHIKL